MAENKIDNGDNIAKSLINNVAGGASSILSIKPMAKFLSGARCILKVNGRIIGFAFAISWDIRTHVTEINTIDDYLPYELAPQRVEVSGAISGFRIPGSGPGQTLLQADVESFIHQRYIDIEVRDSQTDNLIFLTTKAMITSRTENIKIDQLADMTMAFKAIGYRDERDPSIPDGVGKAVGDGSSSFKLPEIKLPF